mmetsp:Transcript_13723/g.20909  ORF Transcript_13723/g.20909 Transcript_13723/m.20909 type:complete len:89 (+) Transcript_13723:128-394(+)
MVALLLSLLFISTIFNSSYGLLIPDLPALVPKLFGSQLNFKVAFGPRENPFQIQGLKVDLDGTCRQKPKNGISSGIFDATLMAQSHIS